MNNKYAETKARMAFTDRTFYASNIYRSFKGTA